MSELGVALKNFQNNFVDFVKNNEIHDTVTLVCNNYQLILTKNYDNIKVEFRYFVKNTRTFVPYLTPFYISTYDLNVEKENCFFDEVKNELNNIIERCQTLIEEM